MTNTLSIKDLLERADILFARPSQRKYGFQYYIEVCKRDPLGYGQTALKNLIPFSQSDKCGCKQYNIICSIITEQNLAKQALHQNAVKMKRNKKLIPEVYEQAKALTHTPEQKESALLLITQILKIKNHPTQKIAGTFLLKEAHKEIGSNPELAQTLFNVVKEHATLVKQKKAADEGLHQITTTRPKNETVGTTSSASTHSLHLT